MKELAEIRAKIEVETEARLAAEQKALEAIKQKLEAETRAK